MNLSPNNPFDVNWQQLVLLPILDTVLAGVIANIRHSTRCKYHYSIKEAKRLKDITLANKLASEMINNDYVNFWKDIRRLNGKCYKLPSKVENTVGESNIAELFKNKYSELYNCVSYNKNEMSNLDKKINNGIVSLCAK